MNVSATILALISFVTSARGDIGLDGDAALDRPTSGAGGKSLRRREDSRHDDAPPPLNTGASDSGGYVKFDLDILDRYVDWSDTNDQVKFYFYAGDKLLTEYSASGLEVNWVNNFCLAHVKMGRYDGSTGWQNYASSPGTPTHVDVFIMGEDAAWIDQACMGIKPGEDWTCFGMNGEKGYCLSTDSNDNFGWRARSCYPGLQFRYDNGKVYGLHHGPPSSSGLLLA